MNYRGVIHTVEIIFRKLKILIGYYNLIDLKIRQISIKEKSLFWGRTLFRKFPGSIIEIGSNSKFISTNGYNLIGINRPCTIATMTPRAQIKIGDNCGFSGTVIVSFDKIIFENNVKCGANTLITDSDWHKEDFRSGCDQKVHIKKNVWLGEGVRVLKGVTIGENTLIGAGSIVVKSIPANVIAAGNPCKVIRKIE